MYQRYFSLQLPRMTALKQQILWQNPCYSKRTWWSFAGLGFPAFQWPPSNLTFIWFVGLQMSFLVGCWIAVTNLLGWSRWTKEASYQTPIPKSSQVLSCWPTLFQFPQCCVSMFCSNCDFFATRLSIFSPSSFVHTKSQVLRRHNLFFSTLLDGTGATFPPHI